MAIKDYVKPYIDDKMTYDYDGHKYILKADYAGFETGLDLLELWETQENLQWYFDFVSRVCYNYIYQFKSPKYRKRMEYYMAHSEYMRLAITEIMVDTITYNFEDGGFLIAYQTGINLKEMKELQMRIDMALSVVGEKIVRNYMLEDRVIYQSFDVESDTYGTEW